MGIVTPAGCAACPVDDYAVDGLAWLGRVAHPDDPWAARMQGSDYLPAV